MRRGIFAPVAVVAFAIMAGGWLLQEGVDRAENVYVRVRVLQEVVDRVESSFVDEVDATGLYDSAIDGLIRDLGDPHSSFLPADGYENLRIRTEGEYGGVGLEVIDRNDRVTVVSPIPSTPGERAGIRAGDQFHEIDGILADTMVTDQAVELLRGRPGQSVTVKMIRPGVEEPIEFTVERATITLRAVPYAFMLEDGIGYVPLQTVRETSSREVRAAVDSLQAEGLEKLVLDLRGNPGGLLDEGIAVSDLFLDRGLSIVETRGREERQNDTYAASGPDRYEGVPIVVLVDGTSASASEIIAGAIQDHDRGAVIGETSYGKGSVQTLYRLTGGDVLRLTTARWYTPVGRSITREPSEGPDSLERLVSISGQMITPTNLYERPEFESTGGRAVYGGGGITPDLFVAPETLSPAETTAAFRMFRRWGAVTVALFNYSVTYVADHPELERGFSVTDADLDAFYSTLPEGGAEIDRDDFAGAARFMRYHLEREIALQAWGTEGQFDHSWRGDRQITTAVEMLRGVSTTEELLTAVSAAEIRQNQDQ
ncbi:MAG: S41 family peptidase [Longimicrobiales bacterium]|nr:S41 family peptidase [Longimicrobiales bacterium]